MSNGYELDTIAAVVVGGTALSGGKGTPIGAVVGGLIIAIIANIMNLMTIPSEPQLVVKGILILVSVIFISGKHGVRVRKREPARMGQSSKGSRSGFAVGDGSKSGG